MSKLMVETTVLSKIWHWHLVSLIVYCKEQPEMILVYEFMGKGQVRNRLYGSDQPSLSWKQRLQICINSTRVLHYLYTRSSERIIHLDIKSANMFVNDVAKVADFGLSKAIESQRHFWVPSSRVLQEVLPFELILRARPVVDNSLPREPTNLFEWAMGRINGDSLANIIAGQVDPNSLRRKFVETIEKCLAEHGSNRPLVGDVLRRLQYALQLQKIWRSI